MLQGLKLEQDSGERVAAVDRGEEKFSVVRVTDSQRDLFAFAVRKRLLDVDVDVTDFDDDAPTVVVHAHGPADAEVLFKLQEPFAGREEVTRVIEELEGYHVRAEHATQKFAAKGQAAEEVEGRERHVEKKADVRVPVPPGEIGGGEQ